MCLGMFFFLGKRWYLSEETAVAKVNYQNLWKETKGAVMSFPARVVISALFQRAALLDRGKGSRLDG